MGISNVKSNPVGDDPHRYGGSSPVPAKPKQAKKSSAAEQKALHAKLMNWFLQERDKQASNRMEMATDEDFYDGLQWSDEDAEALMERGQAPIVFNQVKPTINWMLGTERRTRFDGKALPRSEDDEDLAEVKTKLLKYLSDVNRTAFKRSEAFKSQIVAGIGWMEDSINKDPGEELLNTDYVDWKNIYHDSNSKQLDLSDARYVFRWSFIDLDVALAMCPGKENSIKAAAVEAAQINMDEDDVWYLGSRVNTSSSGDFAGVGRRGMAGGLVSNGRERVKIIECWYTVPVNRKVCRACDMEGQQYDGEEYDESHEGMNQALQDGYLSVASHVAMEMRVAVMLESTLLYEAKSPYKHNRFPFTPQWCYRRARDGMPYGVIRDIRDAQIDYNKRASKALFILSTVRVIMDEDAVEDEDELRREIARPNAIIKKRKGSTLEIDSDKSLADQHIKLMMFDGQAIRDVGGVTDQNLGKDDKGLSGDAIGKLQDQGGIVTAHLFDNVRLAIQIQSEKQLSLLEQYYTQSKVVRIIGQNRPIDWLKINQWDATEGRYVNDITRSKADFIVAEQDYKASIQQAMFLSMMDLVSKLEPQVGLALLDLVVSMADIPNKDEMVSRIRKINGQADPSKRPTPEEMKAQAEREAQAKEAEQVAMQTGKAQLELAQAQVEKMLGEVQKIAADTQRLNAQAIEVGVKAAYEALQAGQIVLTNPGMTPTADAILAGAGYQQQGGDDPNLPEADAQAVQQAAQAQIDQMSGAEPIPPAMDSPAPEAMEAPTELQQADGIARGIETPQNDAGI